MTANSIVNQPPLDYFGFDSWWNDEKTRGEHLFRNGMHIAGYIPIVSMASGGFISLWAAYTLHADPTVSKLDCITAIGRGILEILGYRWLLMGADAVVTILRLGVSYTPPSAVQLKETKLSAQQPITIQSIRRVEVFGQPGEAAQSHVELCNEEQREGLLSADEIQWLNFWLHWQGGRTLSENSQGPYSPNPSTTEGLDHLNQIWEKLTPVTSEEPRQAARH